MGFVTIAGVVRAVSDVRQGLVVAVGTVAFLVVGIVLAIWERKGG